MTMADMLYAKGGAFGIAHCNFHLRGADSDADAALVRDWASSRGIPFHGADFDTAAYASEKGISIEMAARELRYRFFAETARREGYDKVAVAHHAEDNAETLILNLLRGTGVRGMAGMRPSGPLPVEGYGDILLERPLLEMTREEIRSYAESHGVPFREDRTNGDDTFKRNRIRNRVFPEFAAINPSFVRTLARDMKHVAEVGAIADDYYAVCKAQVWDGEIIDLRKLQDLPHWRHVLYRLLEEQGFNEAGVEDVLSTLSSGGTVSGKLFSSPEATFVTGASGLRIGRYAEIVEHDVCTVVEGPGTYHLAGTRFTVETLARTEDFPLRQPAGVLVMDAAAMPFPFLARGWKAGDWLRPLGLHGRKKVSDLFVDLKLDRMQKGAAVVLVRPGVNTEKAATDHVAALLGYRIDESVKVTASTTGILRVKVG